MSSVLYSGTQLLFAGSWFDLRAESVKLSAKVVLAENNVMAGSVFPNTTVDYVGTTNPSWNVTGRMDVSGANNVYNRADGWLTMGVVGNMLQQPGSFCFFDAAVLFNEGGSVWVYIDSFGADRVNDNALSSDRVGYQVRYNMVLLQT